jgi:hypothetical protein
MAHFISHGSFHFNSRYTNNRALTRDGAAITCSAISAPSRSFPANFRIGATSKESQKRARLWVSHMLLLPDKLKLWLFVVLLLPFNRKNSWLLSAFSDFPRVTPKEVLFVFRYPSLNQ